MNNQIIKTIETPLSDADIKEYLPEARILLYSELAKYITIEDLLTKEFSYCFILYEDSKNSGHWCCISRPKENIIEYFDSYGGVVDKPLDWSSKEKKLSLGETEKFLSNLFSKCDKQVVYNKIDYQSKQPGVADCGRWCLLRILKMIAGLDLNQFYQFVKDQDKLYIGGKDALVVQLIP